MERKEQAILFYTKKGEYENVKSLLIEKNFNINVLDDLGDTALLWACYYKHVNIVELLLYHNADPNFKGRFGMTAIQNSLYFWDTKPSKINVNDIKKTTQTIKLLLKYGSNVNIHDHNNKTPLIKVCEINFISNYYLFNDDDIEKYYSLFNLTQLLLNNNAMTNVMDNDGYTALGNACKNGYIDTVKLLLKYGANPNYYSQNIKYPILIAGHYGYYDIFILLLENGANLYYNNNDYKYGDCNFLEYENYDNLSNCIKKYKTHLFNSVVYLYYKNIINEFGIIHNITDYL